VETTPTYIRARRLRTCAPNLQMNALRIGLQDLDAAVLQNAALGILANSLRDKPTRLAVLAFTIARATGMTRRIGPFSSRFRSIREAPKKSTEVMSLLKKRLRFWG
jgi:hypothetical protein